MGDKRYLVLLAVLALVGVPTSSLNNLNEGESCTTHNNRPGLCTKFRQCPSAIKSVRRRQLRPKVCSYDTEPIICCEEQIAPNTILSQSLTVNSYKIAEKKCQAYAELAFVNRELEILLPTQEFVRELECVKVGEELIVGGEKADPGEFPHMVALGYPSKSNEDVIEWNCAGSLISDQFVLTAAHCKHSNTKRVRFALLGAQSLKGALPTDKAVPETLNVVEFIVHEGYKKKVNYHDIALAKLERPATLTPYLRPACLHTDPQEINRHKYFIATGWGFTNGTTLETTDVLMKVGLELTPHETCQAGYPSSGPLLPRGIDNTISLCAGDPEGVKDTCMGDSGGPLQVFKNSNECTFIIVGVTSFGTSQCVSNEQSGLYTRVQYYVPWIQGHVWP